MQIKAVILDFGGVISKTMFETHPHSEKALGLPAGSLMWRGPFDPASDELWTRMLADEISERDYWLSRAREIGRALGEDWDSMHQLVQRARGQDPAAVIRPQALDALSRFLAAGLKLGLLSNELELFYGKEFLQHLDFLGDFVSIVDASFSDILKPDLRAYQQSLNEIGLPAEQCLFIDDQPRNIDGAKRAGMHTVQFDVREPAKSYNEALTKAGLDPAPHTL